MQGVSTMQAMGYALLARQIYRFRRHDFSQGHHPTAGPAPRSRSVVRQAADHSAEGLRYKMARHACTSDDLREWETQCGEGAGGLQLRQRC